MLGMKELMLKDKKALVVGIANEGSIAYGCAKAFKHRGADLAIAYLSDKAKPYMVTIYTRYFRGDTKYRGDISPRLFDRLPETTKYNDFTRLYRL